MFSQQTRLINPSGLHARPASDFVKAAKAFQSKVTLRKLPSGDEINAKSILMVMAQGLGRGADIEITADGTDEKAAVTALVDMITAGFGEI